MKRIFFLSLFPAFCLQVIAQPLNPLFQRVATSTSDQVYDTRAWSFNTGAPVRSTPLVLGDFLYAGNAAGDFYCINKKNGVVKWTYKTGSPVHSSAIADNGKVYFSDNQQVLYALDALNGKLRWKTSLGKKKNYPWRFDYYYSSPILHDGKLFIGSDDANFYAIDPGTGNVLWKYGCKGIVRSTAAVKGSTLYVGDTEATLYAIDSKTGKERWQYHINGDTLDNENFGFDRRAITSSAVVAGDKLIFGARDGYLYCIDNRDGKDIWKADHRVSWIISTVAVKDTFVVTGTSDGRFIQALSLETGREIWKYRTAMAVWTSPLIVNDQVYAGGFDGQLYCVDLRTGKRISQFKTEGMMMSSPVWNDKLLYTASDDGNIYALKGREDKRVKENTDRYVYYEPGVNVYYRGGADLPVKNYLAAHGYKTISSDTLSAILSSPRAAQSVIVFASCYFPPGVTANGKESLLRKFLDAGGRIVLTGINPLVYKIDAKTKSPYDFSRHTADTVLGIDYGQGDTRSFMGQYPSFATEEGKQLGLADYWVNSLYVDAANVDVILGKGENGEASAFTKRYRNGGTFVQLWIDQEKPVHLDAVIKAAEWQIN